MPAKGYVEIDKEMCKGCNLCVINCPTDCLALNTSETNSFGLHFAYLVEPDDCIACANCGVICPDAAITVFRKLKEPKSADAGAGSAAGSSSGAGAGQGA